MLELSVCDLGPGIPEGEAASLFEPFVQGTPPPGSAAIKGSGLGLAIVRELIGAHGGEVGLRPHSPTGTCACIRLPLGLTPATPMP
jgi:signal transduction histidine kinase